MVLRAGFHGTVGQPSAQVIDGSLKFAGGTTGSSNQYLEHTFRSDGNRKTFTFSFWLKRSDVEAYPGIFFCGSSSVDPNNLHMYFNGDTLLLYSLKDGSNVRSYNTTQQFRDISGWYHIVVAVDSTISSPALDRFKVYVNGDRVTEFSSSNHNAVDENTNFTVNQSGKKLEIGLLRNSSGALSYTYNGNMSQWYFIDGQALGPGYFGFTDPLTGTWRPKKFRAEGTTVNDGTQWSSLVDVSNATVNNGSAANLFDGDTSTKINISGGYIEIDLSSRNVQAGPEGIEVYNNEGGAYTSYQVNGGTAVNWQASAGWMSMGGANSKINTIRINYLSGGGVNAAFAFRVNGVTMVDSTTTNLSFGTNGFYLPMDGNSPIGEDKSGNVTPNNGSIWSSFLTSSSGFRSSEPKTNAFDGNTSSICSAVGSGTITFTSPVTFASNSTIKVFLHGGDHTVTVNGGSDQTISAGSFQTVTYSNSGNANFVMTFHRGGGADTGVRAIEINGVILTDNLKGNSCTPVNFGGSNSVDKASGALPILNTVSGGNHATVGVRTDAHASNLVLALPLVGNKEDVVASINSAQTNVTVTNNGSVPFQATQSNFYGGSAFFEDSSSDNLTFTNFGSRFEFTGDYTIEAWIYPTDSGAADGSIFVENSGSDYFAFNFDPGTQFNVYNNSSSASWSPSTNLPPVNKWSHIALVRSGSTQKIYVNGNSIATNTASGTHGYASPSFARIGGGASSGLDSYIQDLRVYKGVAKYTENFVPASTSPEILPDTPSGVSGSSKLTKITDGAVSFDGTGDFLGLANTTDVNFGSGDFTWECFAYFNTVTGSISLMGQWENSTNRRSWLLQLNDGKMQSYLSSSGNSGGDAKQADSPANYMVANRWYHIAVTRSGNNMRLFIDGVLITTTDLTGFTVYANTDDGFAIGSQKASGSNVMNGFISNVRILKGTALYTANFTPPSRALTNVTNTKLLCCQSVAEQQNNFIRMFLSDTLYTSKADILANATEVGDGESGISNKYWYIVPTGTEPDGGTSAVFTNDGSVTTPHSSNHFALYHRSGSSWVQTSGTYGPSEYSDFKYKTQDSTASGVNYSVVPSRDFYVFGADSGGSAPKLISGTLPTRAKYYKFNGAVKPGAILANGDAAATNFNPFNTDINTVRGQESGYATWNPLKMGTSSVSMSEGNLFWRTTSNGPDRCTYSTIGMDSGKFYWENEIVEATATAVGIANEFANQDGGPALAHNWMYYSATGQTYIDGSASSYGDAYNTNGTIIGVAFDRDNLTLEFYKNGVSQGKLTSISGLTDSETYFAMCGDSGGASQSQVRVNFGQKPFKFSPPDGFQPLNTANVRPETVIARPDQYVGIVTYTGDAPTAQQITGLNFGTKPDFVWVKNYSDSTGYHHGLFDTVRGANKVIRSSQDGDEDTTTQQLMSFDHNGFTVGDNSDSQNYVNLDADAYVAWCWKAGGDKNTFNIDDVGYASAAAAGITGLDGTGEMTTAKFLGCSIGTKQGFSIIKYRGLGGGDVKVPHGLSQTPDMVIVKNLDSSVDWAITHSGLPGNRSLRFTDASTDASGFLGLNKGGLASTYFTINYTDTNLKYVNASNEDYIAYCWHNVPGLQKFGKYTGNNASAPKGPFVELGFRPALVAIKRQSGTGNWIVYDNKRDTFNPLNGRLYWNTGSANVDNSGYNIDFLSNGFRITGGNNDNYNASSDYVYAAWAEAPTINLYGGQSNAR